MEKIEIERKFLLKRLPSGIEPINKIYIRQYYCDNERWRESQDKNGIVYECIIKTNLEKGINKEEHRTVDYVEFLNKIQRTKNKKIISKIRNIYQNVEGLIFEIDDFTNLNLVICEVELSDINQKINFPDEIKKVIIKEVTGEKEFDNFNLAE